MGGVPHHQQRRRRRHPVAHWLSAVDLCLSFALFKLQLWRFTGCPLAESGCRHALMFVQESLLVGSTPERAFRVVEKELSFVADFLYSFFVCCLAAMDARDEKLMTT